jgi:hypothetical protein
MADTQTHNSDIQSFPIPDTYGIPPIEREDGQPPVARALCFDLNALVAVEQQSGGKSIFHMQELGAITGLRLRFWAGLLWQDPDLTLEEAGQLLTLAMQGGGTVQELNILMMQALTESGLFVQEKKGEKGGSSRKKAGRSKPKST